MHRKMEKLVHSKHLNCFDQNRFHRSVAYSLIFLAEQEKKERNPEKRPNTRD